MALQTMQSAGRVLIVRWSTALDGSGPDPDQVVRFATAAHTRFVVLDTTRCAYASSEGLRWIQQLRNSSLNFRIVARPGQKVSRALKLVHLDNNLFDSARTAFRTPWARATLAAG
jgi:hypothetical protein